MKYKFSLFNKVELRQFIEDFGKSFLKITLIFNCDDFGKTVTIDFTDFDDLKSFIKNNEKYYVRSFDVIDDLTLMIRVY